MPSLSREAALEVLNRCSANSSWSAQSLDTIISRRSLDRRDSALAYRISLGVLQNETLLDYYVGHFLTSKKITDITLQNILRLGAYQILFNDRIPPRAAVNEAVELCKEHGLKSAAGLANAVLRRLSESRDNLPGLPDESREKYLSVRYSHPEWLCRRLCEEFGPEKAEQILSFNNSVPPMTVQVNSLKISSPDYRKILEDSGIKYTAPDDSSFLISDSSVTDLPGYEEGMFYIQDNAARRSVAMLEPKAGMHVLDACSAPGGKSFASAIMMKNAGTITACDIHEKKLRLIETSAKRLGIDIIQTRSADSGKYIPEYTEKFDAVIADVPCSGFGVISQKPEIRFKAPENTASLPSVQKRIVDNVAQYVAPGGRLLYSTCTIFHEENQDVIREFLSGHSDFTLTEERLVLPGEDNCGGFYAACMERTES